MLNTPLENIENWSKEHVARMKESWVTTAEQVVALGATEGGMTSIAEQLKVSENEARKLVDSAEAGLSPEAKAEMAKFQNNEDFGLGALHPSEQNDR